MTADTKPSARDVIGQCLWHHATTPTADAILAALRAAGYVVVPSEPTEAMVQAAAKQCGGGFYRQPYRAMLSAAEGDAP
jgi:hypothetical protein